jgi:hypothetical protein
LGGAGRCQEREEEEGRRRKAKTTIEKKSGSVSNKSSFI